MVVRYTYQSGILADLDGVAVMVPDQIAQSHLDDLISGGPFPAIFCSNNNFVVTLLGVSIPVKECDVPALSIDVSKAGESVLVEYTPDGLEEFWYGTEIPCVKAVVPLSKRRK